MTNRTQLGIGLSVIIILLLIGIYAYDGSGGTTSPVPTQLRTDTTVGTTSPSAPDDSSSAAGGTFLTAEERCANEGGTWSAEFKECAGIGESRCVAIGGTWNDCASPCRNNPNAEACIQMCVQICSL